MISFISTCIKKTASFTYSGFTELISLALPYEKSERKYFWCMTLLQFSVLLAYCLTRIIKDSLLIVAIGSKYLSGVKLGMVLPAALMTAALYTSLSAKYSRDTMFYGTIGSSIAFFTLFALVLYPNKEYLALSDETMDNLINMNYRWVGYLPHSICWFFSLIKESWRVLVMPLQHWPLTLFYIASEISGNMTIAISFWKFANAITHPEVARRVYATFNVFSNCALIVAGILGSASYTPKLKVLGAVFSLSMSIVIYSVIVSDDSIMAYAHTQDKYIEKQKKPNFSESIGVLSGNKIALLLLSTLFAYNVIANLSETLYKDAVEKLSIDASLASGLDSVAQRQYYASQIFGKQFVYIGILCLIMGVFSNLIMRHYSWTIASLFGPVLIAITTFAFLASLIFPCPKMQIFNILHPLCIPVQLGLMQNVVAKSCKYIAVDFSKESLFTVMPAHIRGQLKPAIELIGGRGGKALGAAVQVLLYSILALITGRDDLVVLDLLIFIIPITVLLLILWFIAIIILGDIYAVEIQKVTKASPMKEETKSTVKTSSNNAKENAKKTKSNNKK